MGVLETPQEGGTLHRRINTPTRGIGEETGEGLMKGAVSRGKPIWDAMISPEGVQIPPNGVDGVRKLIALIERYRADIKAGKPLADLLRRLVADIAFEAELKRLYPDPNELQARWAAVEEVVNALAAYEKTNKKATLGGFLDEGLEQLGLALPSEVLAVPPAPCGH